MKVIEHFKIDLLFQEITLYVKGCLDMIFCFVITSLELERFKYKKYLQGD